MSSITCPNTNCGAVMEGTDLRHCNRCGAFLPPSVQDPVDPLIGQPILNGKYRIVSVIGEGGMGKVYLADQKVGSSTRKVAIKTLQPDLAQDPQIIARFHREAQTVMELEHPNTIRFYDFDEIDLRGKKLLVVMEFIQGESLAHVLARGPLDVARAERILAQVCGSLQEAHDRGIVHRDLKPENIYLTQKGARGDFVKVLDFGIAKRGESGDEKEAKLTRQGMVLGTPPYMSPEQFTGQSLDARSDIYALGVIAYEILTAQLPFSAATPWEWATKHLTAPPTPIEAHPHGARIPERHRHAIMRSLSKNRDERPASVTQFLQEFSGYSEGATDWTASSLSNPSMPGFAGRVNSSGGFVPTPTMPATPPFPLSNVTPTGGPGTGPYPHQTPNAVYSQTSSGHVAAPSSAGFAGVPPIAPPGTTGSNPGLPPGSHFNPVQAAGYVPTAIVPKPRIGLLTGFAAVVVLAIGGVGIYSLRNSTRSASRPLATVASAPQTPISVQPPSTVQGSPTVAQIPTPQRVSDDTPSGNHPAVPLPSVPVPRVQTSIPLPNLHVRREDVRPPPPAIVRDQVVISSGLAALASDNYQDAMQIMQRVAASGNAPGAARLRNEIRRRGHNRISNLVLNGDCRSAQALFRQLRSAGAAPTSTDSFGDACPAP